MICNKHNKSGCVICLEEQKTIPNSWHDQDFKFNEPEYLENNPEYQGDLIDEAEYSRGER